MGMPRPVRVRISFSSLLVLYIVSPLLGFCSLSDETLSPLSYLPRDGGDIRGGLAVKLIVSWPGFFSCAQSPRAAEQLLFSRSIPTLGRLPAPPPNFFSGLRRRTQDP